MLSMTLNEQNKQYKISLVMTHWAREWNYRVFINFKAHN